VHRRGVYLAWCACHFALILAVSADGLYSLIADGLTIIPVHRDKGRLQETAWATARRQPAVNQFRELLVTYLHCAGIEGAYEFFAPNVPESYTLALQFEYPDGHVEEDWPGAESKAGGMRLSSLLDKIGRSDSEQFQRVFIKMLTLNVWRAHQQATAGKAVLAKMKLHAATAERIDNKAVYEIVRVYRFSRAGDSQRDSN
jgi:hypothetical protein